MSRNDIKLEENYMKGPNKKHYRIYGPAKLKTKLLG